MAKIDRKIRRFIGFVLLAVIVVTCFSVRLYFDAQYKAATRELNEAIERHEEMQRQQERLLKFQREYGTRPQYGPRAY